MAGEDTAAAGSRDGAPSAWPPGEYEAMIWSHAHADERFIERARATVGTAWEASVAALDVPALVLAPARDGILDAARRDRVAAIGNPRVELVVIPDAGHSIRRDRRDAYHAVVDPFLDAHAR